jgi:hypothetical protein
VDYVTGEPPTLGDDAVQLPPYAALWLTGQPRQCSTEGFDALSQEEPVNDQGPLILLVNSSGGQGDVEAGQVAGLVLSSERPLQWASRRIRLNATAASNRQDLWMKIS